MENQQIKNKSYLKKYRVKLRKKSTYAEIVLWKYLSNKQLLSAKFRRQTSIHDYIVDFYCPECRLIIELDGNGHFTPEGEEKDIIRDKKLSESYYTILRFENDLILKHTQSVLDIISEKILEFREINPSVTK